MFAAAPLELGRPPNMPAFDQLVFQKTRLMSLNRAVHTRIRILRAESGSQFMPVLPCSPTITGLPAAFHWPAFSTTRRSDWSSASDSYQCGALMSIAGRYGFSALVLTGLP